MIEYGGWKGGGGFWYEAMFQSTNHKVPKENVSEITTQSDTVADRNTQ